MQHDYHASQVPPEWHSWITHIRGPAPTEDKVMQNLSPPWKSVRYCFLSRTVRPLMPHSM
jgi:NADH:ubiquinone oxidoreductase subunit